MFKYVMQQIRSLPYIYYHPQQNMNYLHLTSNFPNVTTATRGRSDSDIGVVVIYGDKFTLATTRTISCHLPTAKPNYM